MSGATERGYEQIFGHPPDVCVRAPGRVNLIGEHTDYSGLPVLPIAIQLGTEVAARSTDTGRVVAVSEREGRVELEWRATGGPGYGAYLAGVLEMLVVRGVDTSAGLELFIAGDLPSTGGLSSSSALSLAVLAALDRVLGLGLDAERRVAAAIEAERRVGVETGGMDQTVITFAQRDHALRIDFEPRARRVVAIPSALCFVAAFSGESAPKGARVRDAYNARVVGCRSAAAWLAHALGVETGEPPRLADVADQPGLADALRELPDEARPEEVATRTGREARTLRALSRGTFDSSAPLALAAFAGHVLGEARRVDAFEQALAANERAELGRLLDASHAGLQAFGASTPALDRLTAAMRGAGALGARLTGAGFGGYALAACTPDRQASVLAAATRATGGPAFPVIASEGCG